MIALEAQVERRSTTLKNGRLDLVKLLSNLYALFPKTLSIIPLVSQIVRSATSIGANYVEADGA